MQGRVHYRTSRLNVEELGLCDLCKQAYNRVDLKPQKEWRGSSLQPTGFLRCRKCMDVPQRQNKTLILKPDPVPVKNARPDDNGS